MKSIHIKELDIKKLVNVRSKRERWVFKDNNKFYKFWVPNWTQSLCTKVGIDRGFYDKNTCPLLESLIHDETGQRGYIMIMGKSYNNYKDICNDVSYENRKLFIKSILENAIKSKGIFHDFGPGNLATIEGRLSLIDLDAYRSFSLIFDKQKEEFEKFELNVRWKPYESAVRDVTQKLPLMISAFLDLPLFEIKNEKSLSKIIEKIK